MKFEKSDYSLGREITLRFVLSLSGLTRQSRTKWTSGFPLEFTLSPPEADAPTSLDSGFRRNDKIGNVGVVVITIF